MPYAIQGVVLTVTVQATVRSGDADPTAGTISIAIRKWKQGEGEDGYYYTGSAWQVGVAVVTSTQGDIHAHTAVVDATRMGSLQGWDIEARPADAGAIGPANWYHVGSDQLGDILAAILADTDEIQGKLPSGDIYGEPTGARTIVLHFQEADTTPIPDAMCYIRNAADDTTLWTVGPSDASGDIAMSLNDASYNLRPVKIGVEWSSVPQAMTVSADATVDVEGDVQTPSAPSAPNLCVIYGTLRDAAGEPLIGAEVDAYASTPQVVSAIQMGKRLAHATTDAVGYFELELEKIADVRFSIPDAGRDETLTVPNTANQDIATWT